MSPKTSTNESKILSLVLRHQPELVGLRLGPGGWVPVGELLAGLAKAGHPMTLDRLNQIVADSDKKRFTLSSDGGLVRAAQGHSVFVDLGLQPSKPPIVLWHGTAIENLNNIMREGIKPGTRQHVHLSLESSAAQIVGQRHGKPIALRIAAGEMHAAGHTFWHADNGVWLTSFIPPNFIFQDA